MKIVAAYIFLWIFLMIGLQAHAINYYVGPDGSDNIVQGTGLSEVKPFRTIWFAFQQVLPGDTVFLMNGTYRNPGYGTGNLNNPPILDISKSGEEGAPIILCNLPGHKPILEYDGRAAISGSYISHIEI